MREDYFDKGWNLCIEQFLELFHRYGYIYRPLGGGTWLSSDEKWKLTDSEILKAIACAPRRYLIGTRSGKKTKFAVLDIDANSKYHTKAQLQKLLKVLAAAGLKRNSLYRSSHSGGWHLYIFFEEWLNSAELRKNLSKLLSLNGYEIAKGKLEIFPNPGTGSMGMGLRLPLQEGFAWLDKETGDVDYERQFLSPGKALECFIDVLESDANTFADYRQLKSQVEALEKLQAQASAVLQSSDNVVPLRRLEGVSEASEFAIQVGRIFGGLPPGINSEDWANGRLFHINGLTGPSQRAEAIFTLGHYLFYGDPSRDLPPLGYGYEQERDWAIKEFLAARHNGNSVDIARGRNDALEQVSRAAHWLPPEKRDGQERRYIAKQPIAWVRGNAKKKAGARKKIEDGLNQLRKLRRSFTTVELADVAGVSRSTLNLHNDIWRKDYEDLAAGFFAMCPDEYNVVEEAACPKSKPPSSLQEKIVPPGLLAARRIAFEISRSIQRDVKRSQETSQLSSEASELKWRDKIASLTRESFIALSVKELRALYVVLRGLLDLAPYEEDARALLPYVRQLRFEIETRTRGPDSKAP